MKVSFEPKLNLYRASIGYGWTERWAYGSTPDAAKKALNKELKEQPVLVC